MATATSSSISPTKSDSLLLNFLCTAIARDGGASLVTSLKDHYWAPRSAKRLNQLLSDSSIGKPKLLSFLEFYSQVFQVDRTATPHFVRLLPSAYEQYGQETTVDPEPVESTRQALLQKVKYTLVKRKSRLRRRAQNHSLCSNLPLSYQVNVHWLAQQCVWEIHAYLRAKDFYRTVYTDPQEVHPVGKDSPQWIQLVEPPLRQLLLESKELVEGDPTLGKVWLKEHEVEAAQEVELKQDTEETTTNSNPDWLDLLEEELTQRVLQDGATQVLLALLLHRHASLKQLLGGRDLWEIVQQHPDWFQGIQITQMEGDLVLQRKTWAQEEESATQRMKVDTEGLFSVTNAKWSKSMANTLAQTCTQQGLDTSQMTAIDLTAGVGGMTLGLAKTNLFRQIVALEMDPTRAQLCRDNMKEQGISEEYVQVQTVDSYQAIRTLMEQHSLCCIVIDPPWGGENYKRQQSPLKMGPWRLEQVLERIAQHTKPNNCTIVGLKLPVTLVVETLLEVLREEYELQFEVLIIRKLSVQLWVLLRFGPRPTELE